MIESTNLQDEDAYEHSVVLSRFQGIDNPNQIYNDSMICDDAELVGLERSTNKPYELTHNLESLAKGGESQQSQNLSLNRTPVDYLEQKESPKCKRIFLTDSQLCV